MKEAVGLNAPAPRPLAPEDPPQGPQASPPFCARSALPGFARFSRPGRPAGQSASVNLDSLRQSGLRFMIISGWVMSGLFSLQAMATSPNVWFVVVAGIMINILVTLYLPKENISFSNRLVMAAAATTFPPCLILCFWLGEREINLLVPHLVTVILFIALYDRRIVLIGAGVCTSSFLALKIFERWDDLFEPMFGLGTSMEVVGMIFVTVISYTICARIEELIRSLEDAREESAKRSVKFEEQAVKLERARKRVETERREREMAEAKQRAERQEQLQRFASDFEESISVVTHSISETADLLDRITKTLSAIAHDTGQGAVEVSEGAAAATHAARMVAKGVAELSSSISEIAADVSQQNDLASKATTRSVEGGEAMGGLTKHSDTIGQATRAIVRIAARTNLLSLTAAIEAASAGPAGRGFTIVAQEVKALARQASEAATEIDSFLKGVRQGTREAEVSFESIDSVIASLAENATGIRWEVERQRKSADAIEDYARSAADDVNQMATRSEKLASTASAAQKLSNQLDEAASTMLKNVRDLEQSTTQFVANLKAG